MSETKPKISANEKIRMITLAMNGLNMLNDSKPDHKIIITSPGGLERMPFAVNNRDEITQVSIKFVAQVIERFSQTFGDEMVLTSRPAMEAANSFIATSDIDYREIKQFRFKSDAGLCYNRAKFDPAFGNHPTWDDLYSRMHNSDASKTFWGCVLIGKQIEQYLVYEGEGDAGKGTHLWAMKSIFPAALGAKAVGPHRGDKHYYADIYDKTIVIFDDHDDPTTFSSGPLKHIVSHGTVPVDQKGKPSFFTEFKPLLVFTTNTMPALENSRADLRRAIICKLDVGFEPNDEKRARLNEELPYFIYTCIAAAKNMDSNKIPVDPESFSDATEYNDTKPALFWHKNFVLGDPENDVDIVTPPQTQKCFQDDRVFSSKAQKTYYDWLAKHHGRVMKAHKVDGKSKRQICGLKQRFVPEIHPSAAEETFLCGAISASSEQRKRTLYEGNVEHISKGRKD